MCTRSGGILWYPRADLQDGKYCGGLCAGPIGFKVSVYPLKGKAVPLDKLPVEAQIRKVFGKADYKLALAVSQAENGSRKCDRVSKQNKNGTYDIGVFQINTIHAAKGNLYGCTSNILIAKQIFDRSGWSAWSVYNNGLYKKFL